MIRFACQCGLNLEVPEEKAGKKGKCPVCEAVNRIPAATRIDSGDQANEVIDMQPPPKFPPASNSATAATHATYKGDSSIIPRFVSRFAARFVLWSTAIISLWGILGFLASASQYGEKIPLSSTISGSTSSIGFILSCGFLQVIGAIERAASK